MLRIEKNLLIELVINALGSLDSLVSK